MKINDKKELHTKSAAELRKMLKDGHELLMSLKLDREQNKLKNTRGMFNTRKNIAIIKTILNGKEETVQVKDQTSDLKKEAVLKEEVAAEPKKAPAKKATVKKEAAK